MWEPPYGREGQPITADDPNPNSPQGQYEGEMRFVWGLGGSRYQRHAAKIMFGAILVIVLAVGLVAVIYAT